MTKRFNAFIGIDYSDSYEAVYIDPPSGEKVVFASGDPGADYAAACAHAKGLLDSQQAIVVMTLSSLDHFCHDVPGYRWTDDDRIEADPNYHRLSEEGLAHLIAQIAHGEHLALVIGEHLRALLGERAAFIAALDEIAGERDIGDVIAEKALRRVVKEPTGCV